jgi:hypothetical protein
MRQLWQLKMVSNTCIKIRAKIVKPSKFELVYKDSLVQISTSNGMWVKASHPCVLFKLFTCLSDHRTVRPDRPDERHPAGRARRRRKRKEAAQVPPEDSHPGANVIKQYLGKLP